MPRAHAQRKQVPRMPPLHAAPHGATTATYAGERDAGERAGGHLAIDFGGTLDGRQHPRGNAKELAQLWVPLARVQVHQHGAARIGDIGHKRPAVGAAGEVLSADGCFPRMGTRTGLLDISGGGGGGSSSALVRRPAGGGAAVRGQREGPRHTDP